MFVPCGQKCRVTEKLDRLAATQALEPEVLAVVSPGAPQSKKLEVEGFVPRPEACALGGGAP